MVPAERRGVPNSPMVIEDEDCWSLLERARCSNNDTAGMGSHELDDGVGSASLRERRPEADTERGKCDPKSIRGMTSP